MQLSSCKWKRLAVTSQLKAFPVSHANDILYFWVHCYGIEANVEFLCWAAVPKKTYQPSRNSKLTISTRHPRLLTVNAKSTIEGHAWNSLQVPPLFEYTLTHILLIARDHLYRGIFEVTLWNSDSAKCYRLDSIRTLANVYSISRVGK